MRMGKLLGILLLGGISIGCHKAHAVEDSAWIQIFNGKDLGDWVPKFAGHAAGVNQNDAFQVNNGRLQVIQTKPHSQTGFGHLFYNKRKFSYYLLRGQYRFLVDTSAFASESGGWTVQNNGFMLHAQSAASMGLNQDFPNSIEHQIIGPRGQVNNPPRNANLCVPGTMVSFNGQDYNDQNGHHCTDAKYHSLEYNKVLNNGTWLFSMAKVMSDSLMVFYVKSRIDTAWDSVMGFKNIRTTSPVAQLKEGYITIQDEGSSIEFSKIEVLDLVGCMDKSKSAFRDYFVKNDAAACNVTAVSARPEAADFSLVREGGTLRVRGAGARIAEVRGLDGSLQARFTPDAAVTAYSPRRPGIYLISIKTGTGSAIRKFAAF